VSASLVEPWNFLSRPVDSSSRSLLQLCCHHIDAYPRERVIIIILVVIIMIIIIIITTTIIIIIISACQSDAHTLPPSSPSTQVRAHPLCGQDHHGPLL
jgi:hypothetical protein